jgi:outer membrane protein assembly factor BamB
MNHKIDDLLEKMRGAEVRIPKNLDSIVFEAVRKDSEIRVRGFILRLSEGFKPLIWRFSAAAAAAVVVVLLVSSSMMRIELVCGTGDCNKSPNADQVSVLHQGSLVNVPENSKMTLKIGNYISVNLKGAGTFRVDQALRLPGYDRIRVRVDKGEQGWIVSHPGRKHDLVVSSPDVLIRSLGTEFALKVGNDGTLVELYKDNIAVRRNLGPDARKFPVDSIKDTDQKKILAGMLNTDALLKENEKISVSRNGNKEILSLLQKISGAGNRIDKLMLEQIEQKLPIQRGMIVSIPSEIRPGGWQSDLNGPVWAGWTVCGDDFCFGTEKGDIYRISRTGEVKWKVPHGKAFYNEGFHHDGRFYIVDSDGMLLAVDSSDGHVLWQVKTGQMMYSAPVMVAGNIFLATTTGELFLVAPGDGKVISQAKMPAGFFTKPVVMESSVITAATSGIITCVRIPDLTTVWQTKTKGRIAVSSPVLKDGILYLINNAGDLAVFSAVDGSLLWRKEIGQKTLSTPCVYTGKIFMALVDGRILALDKNGNRIWTVALGDSIEAPINCGNGFILASTMKGRVFMLSSVDGSIRESWSLDGQIISGSVIAGNRFYLGTLGGKVYSRPMD